MDKFTKPLIHYPTTTVFVDDNLTFLQSFSLLLSEEFAFRLFDSPRKALDFINSSPAFSDKRSAFGVDADQGPTESLFFPGKILDKKKYSEVSVVVVDYIMPNMNGIDFCKRLDNPQVKKVLFTGQADETIAVRAMEQGFIDAYILKSSNNVVKTIIDTVAKLKEDYFSVASALDPLSSNEGHEAFVSDPAFEELFDSLIESSEYVEYYYQKNPPGYLLINQNGVCNRLVVYTQESIDDFITRHKKTLPVAIAKAIIAGKVIPYFPPQEMTAYDDSDFRWQAYLYPAKLLQGEVRYHYALIGNPRLQLPINQVPPAYADYLKELDQQVFA